jgi:hypothetical protein
LLTIFNEENEVLEIDKTVKISEICEIANLNKKFGFFPSQRKTIEKLELSIWGAMTFSMTTVSITTLNKIAA